VQGEFPDIRTPEGGHLSCPHIIIATPPTTVGGSVTYRAGRADMAKKCPVDWGGHGADI